MKTNNHHKTGNTTTILLVGVSILALTAGLIGLAISNRSVTQNTEAASMNSQVRLMTIQSGDSGCTQRVTKTGDSSINVCGRICFAQNYRSGGSDTGSLYLTDSTGARAHEGNVTFRFDIASFDFPAPCEYTNRDTGEAELKNGMATKSNLFNIPLSFGSKLSESYCPDIYVNYNSRVVSGRPFAKISLRDAGLCKPEPTVAPTSQPRQENPETTPEPQSEERGEKVTGTLSVYSCKKPEYVGIEVCNDESCNETVSLPYNQSAPTEEVENGLWLQDNNSDNTWIYRYSFSKFKGEQLDNNSIYLFKDAYAKIDSPSQPNSSFYYSKREVNQSLPIRPGDRQDFTVNAAKTCGCPFNATAYVRSGATGEIITDFDKELAVYGSANNKQIVDRGDKPVQTSPFKSGQLKVVIPNFVTNVAGSHGEDSLANIKLYAPGYVVTKQKCVSTGPVDACPTYTKSYEKSGDQLGSPFTFENVRVACGVNVDYGWYVLSPTPTPTPTPEVGNVEVRVFSWVNGDTETPSTCSYNQLSSSIGRGSIYKFLGECELELKDSSGKSVVIKELDAYDAEKGIPGCNYHKFENLRPGRYSLRVGGLTSLFNSQCQDARNFEVKAGETTQVPAIYSVDLDKCDPRHLTETTCSNCKDAGGRCLTRYEEGSNARLCCVGGGGSGGDGGGGGGGGQGECSTDRGLHCTGTAADNPRYANNPQARCDDAGLGQAYGWCGAGNNACCYEKGSGGSGGSGGGGGGGNPPGDPGNPGSDPGAPGTPGTPGTGDNCNYSDTDEETCNAECSQACYFNSSTFNFCCPASSGGNPAPPPPGTTDSCSQSGGTCRSSCQSNESALQGPGLCSANQACCKATDAPSLPSITCSENEDGPFFDERSCTDKRSVRGARGFCCAKTPVRRFYFIEFDLEGRSSNEESVIPQFCEPGRRNCVNLDTIDFRESIIPFRRDYQGTVERMLPTNKTYVATCTYVSFNRISTTTRRNCVEKSVNPGGRPKFTLTHNETGSFEGDFAPMSGLVEEKIDTNQLDLDGNGIINTLDMIILKDAFITSSKPASKNISSSQNPDINGDGKVNALDLSYLINAFGLEVSK